MNNDEINYCLAKQLPRATLIQTDYGDIQLDEEMRAAVEKAVSKVLKNRIGRPIKPHRSGGGQYVG